MEAEVTEQVGADYGERAPERLSQRNGYRPRPWDIRVGTLWLDALTQKEREAGRIVNVCVVVATVVNAEWRREMLGIDVGASPLPKLERRLEFIKLYAEYSGKRLAALQQKVEAWWEEQTMFFDVERSRAWVMTRRIAHTAHHRGQQMAMLRMFGHEVHSNYGPTADTGGLMQNHAPTIYAYSSVDALLRGEDAGGAKNRLPGSGDKPVTERPGERL